MEFYKNRIRTWFKVVKPLPQDDIKETIVLLHGGPGAGHDYLTPYTELAKIGFTVYLYDQVGCGRSSHFPKRGVDFFNIDLFLKQLDALLEHENIANYHVLGHSWGGMLAVEHAIRNPQGMKTLIIASAPPSIKSWFETAKQLWKEQSLSHQNAFAEAEKSHDFSSSIFQEAKDEYYRRHLGDFSEKPECLARSDFESENDGYTYELMWGPYEFFPFGSLETWDRTQSLAKISVPTLLLAGEHDQVTAETLQPFMDSIPDVTCKFIPNASHVPHLENPSATFEVVNKFLLSHSS